MKQKKILFPLFIAFLTSCSSYNEPADYEFSETIWTEKNGNQLIRCFSHINAFVDKKDWYYAIKRGDNFMYYKLAISDKEKLLLMKRHRKKNL